MSLLRWPVDALAWLGRRGTSTLPLMAVIGIAVPVLGLPAVAVPTGLADGLPMGVQIIGPRFREDACLDCAEAIEVRAGAITPIDPKW